MRFLNKVSILILTQLLLSLSYYGTETLIVIYLMHVFLFSESSSLSVYGVYVGLLYTLPILAGILSDRFVGVKNGFILGSVFSIIANLFMLIKSPLIFSFGLSFLIVGAGFMKSCILSLVGNHTNSASHGKEKVYTLLYVSNNVGAAIGPLIYGLMIYRFGWNTCFAFSSLSLIMTMLLFIFFYRQPDLISKPIKSILLASAGSTAIALLLVIPFYFIQAASPIILTLFAFSFGYLALMVLKQSSLTRRHLSFLIILCFFGIFYYIAGMQMGSTILLLIENAISSEHLHFSLPANTFAGLYAFFVVLFSPLIQLFWNKTRNRNISVVSKFAFGIMLGGLALICFACSSSLTIPLTMFLLGIAFLSIGELVITPAIYTAISDYSPKNMKTSMMGCWLLFVSLGSYLSTIVAKHSHQYSLRFTDNPSFHEFLIDAIIVFAGGIALFLISPSLIKYCKIDKSIGSQNSEAS